MRTRRAQIAYEFLLLFFFLTAMFTAAIIVAAAARERIDHETTMLHVEDLGRSLQEDFYTAAQMPEGFTRNITLPTSLNGRDYEASIHAQGDAHWLEVTVAGTTMDYRLPPVEGEELQKPPAVNTLARRGATITINEET